MRCGIVVERWQLDERTQGKRIFETAGRDRRKRREVASLAIAYEVTDPDRRPHEKDITP
jgi:hypothetical protein